MRLEKIVEAVVKEMRRPDITADVIRATRATILHLHGSAGFAQDLVEDIVEVTQSAIVKINLPPRFRKFNVVMPLDSKNNPIRLPTRDGYLEAVSPSEIMTPGGRQVTNCYYVAGAAVVCRSQTAFSKLYLQYYQTPEVSDPNLETWIMAQYPELVMLGVKARVYNSPLRNPELAQATKQQYVEDLETFLFDQGGN